MASKSDLSGSTGGGYSPAGKVRVPYYHSTTSGFKPIRAVMRRVRTDGSVPIGTVPPDMLPRTAPQGTSGRRKRLKGLKGLQRHGSVHNVYHSTGQYRRVVSFLGRGYPRRIPRVSWVCDPLVTSARHRRRSKKEVDFDLLTSHQTKVEWSGTFVSKCGARSTAVVTMD